MVNVKFIVKGDSMPKLQKGVPFLFLDATEGTAFSVREHLRLKFKVKVEFQYLRPPSDAFDAGPRRPGFIFTDTLPDQEEFDQIIATMIRGMNLRVVK